MSKKPDDRKTKKAEEGAKKDKQPKAAHPPKAQKVKGPGPASYAPNPLKVRAKEITSAQVRYPAFCQGKLGLYTVGLIDGIENKMFEMEVRVFYGDSEQFLIIKGPWAFRGKNLWIRHEWIFSDPSMVPYAKGDLGVVQWEMLTFIQRATQQELLAEKVKRSATPVNDETVMQAPVQAAKAEEEVIAVALDEGAINYATAFSLNAPSLIGKMKEGEKPKLLCYGDSVSRVYFMRERIAGAQKIRLIKADDHPELTAVMEAHPQGVDVDVRSVIDGIPSSTTIGTLADLKHARMHVAQRLHGKLPEIGFRLKQPSKQT